MRITVISKRSAMMIACVSWVLHPTQRTSIRMALDLRRRIAERLFHLPTTRMFYRHYFVPEPTRECNRRKDCDSCRFCMVLCGDVTVRTWDLWWSSCWFTPVHCTCSYMCLWSVTCASVIKQQNSVLAGGQWCCAATARNVGLAFHWPVATHIFLVV